MYACIGSCYAWPDLWDCVCDVAWPRRGALDSITGLAVKIDLVITSTLHAIEDRMVPHVSDKSRHYTSD
ncbi:hypothetical protein EUGRSUZ_A02897 [Eucalyptus grandis]|uniref:Uncharacterized protein n=2 Tax=Eucalyptus grandis TaxID=71139 RepID=A0ACC3M993_EUCGR|nr:hypothetical protein EUGRSUZ_A02897 [Eucalyptus grandis]